MAFEGGTGDNAGMLDTHAVARSLTEAEFTPAQADALTNAIRLAAEHGDQVTTDRFEAGLARLGGDLRVEMAAVETRLVRWLVGVVLGAAGVTVAAVAALLAGGGFWLAPVR